jgi:signal transduction histidine kinase
MRMASLRARLTLLSTLVIAVALVVAGVLLSVEIGSTLQQSIEDTASDQARVAADDADAGRFVAAGRVGTAADTVVQVIDPSGRLVAHSRNASGKPQLFRFATGPRFGFHDTGRLRVGNSADSYRVAALRSRDGFAVYVAVASDDRHDTLHSLNSALAVGLPVVIVALGFIAWLVIGRALGPVDRLRQQAAAISEEDPTSRLTPPRATELRRLAETLNELLGRLQHAVGRQREFVADAAHELRTPLASLRTSLEVAAGAGAVDTGALLAQVDRLSGLTEDLLHLARLDSGEQASQALVDLDDVVFDAVAQARSVTGVPIDTSEVSAARVRGSAGALGRLVRNLLDNACRHAQSRVTVKLSVDGDSAVLTVADDGPGIAPEDREQVFERFTRLDASRQRDAGGVGLGLAIVAQIAAAHGGSVTISDASPGAEFVVRLPVLRD